jgi:hypothetical protein
MSALDQIERAYIVSGSLFPLCVFRMYANLMCDSYSHYRFLLSNTSLLRALTNAAWNL